MSKRQFMVRINLLFFSSFMQTNCLSCNVLRYTKGVSCDLVVVKYKKNYLEKCYRNKKDAIKRWGLDVGTKYVKQLGLIYASQTIDDLYLIPQLGFHPLRENRKGDYVVKLCAEAGIAVAFIRDIPKTYINGATFWFNKGQTAAILLSLRFKTNDHLWFSFFHELGHILLHKKKDTFLELQKKNLTEKDEKKEDEANTLIPEDYWNNFKIISSFTKKNVESFADHLGIPPGIVVGRLQKEKLLPYTHLNGLKQKYIWVTST